MEQKDHMSYWMLADTELPIAKDVRYKTSFESHFKHGLLFNQKLMISDAQAVNCVNLRKLIKEDSSFRELLNKDLLAIAIRAPEHTPEGLHLIKVRDAFLYEKKQNMDRSAFEFNEDLEYIQENCDILTYDYVSLRKNYTDSIFKIFSGRKAEEIFGSETQKILLDRLRIEENRDKGLGRVFLQKNLADDLKRIDKFDIWERFHRDIIKFSDAPYVTGLSSILKTNPIYSPLHQESFDLVFSQKSIIEEIDDEIAISTHLDLSTYEQALTYLSAEDILNIRSTYEFDTYQNFLKNGVRSEKELKNAQEALIEYQNKIDEYLIKKRLGKKIGRASKVERFIKPLRKVAQEGGVFSLGLQFSDVITGGLLSIANFFISEIIEKSEEVSKREIEIEKRKFVSTLEMKQQIDAKLSMKSSLSETIYSSVR